MTFLGNGPSPSMLSYGIQMSKVSEGQRSEGLWRLTWQGWLFTGTMLREEETGKAGESEQQRGGEKESRRAVFTVLPSKSPCANCSAYVGLCNLRPSRHARLGLAWSWRLTQKCEDRGRDGEEGTSPWGCHGMNKETLSVLWFECLPSNQQLQADFFVVLTTSVGSIHLKLCVW